MTFPQDTTRLQSEMRAAVREHWKAFLIEGILLVILGLAAMIVPPVASLAVTIFLGWMFLISGIAGLALTFWARQMPGFWWSLISAALAVGAGIILLARPVQGTLTLTIVVGAYFLAEGVVTLVERIVGIAQVLFRRHLIGAGLPVTDWSFASRLRLIRRTRRSGRAASGLSHRSRAGTQHQQRRRRHELIRDRLSREQLS